MKKNLNKSGRFIRVILGLVLLIASIIDLSEDQIIDNLMFIIGIILILAGIISFCPINAFLGIDGTKSRNKHKMY